MNSEATASFFKWLSQDALPLWSTRGIDPSGGFVERIEVNGELDMAVRRARLVARQIYAFRAASEIGWSGPADALIEHGARALLAHHVSSDHVAIPRYVPETGLKEGGFDLYDQAFVLFGFRQLAEARGGAEPEQLAKRMLQRMRGGWQHPLGGFCETDPASSPLKANPHMHLLEAALAWLEVSDAEEWVKLASEVAELCLNKFIDPQSGALQEFFDVDWSRLSDTNSHVVEPGHQAEWAWLLVRWFRRTRDRRFFEAAKRLFELSEELGVNQKQNKFINELGSDFQVRDGRMRLWPQTERIKALVIFCEETTDEADRAHLMAQLEATVAGLLDFFRHPIEGSWWEHLDEHGQACLEPARASSLYHIMGAATELARFSGQRIN